MSTLKSRMLSKWGPMAVVGTVLDVGSTVSTIKGSREQGDSMPITIGKAALDAYVGAKLGLGAGILYGLATTGYEIMLDGAKQNAEFQKQAKYIGSGRVGSGYFNMSGAGYTMRQRAMNQIRSNGQNVNSVLGNEARNYLKASRDYN